VEIRFLFVWESFHACQLCTTALLPCGTNTGENERCVCLCVFITVFVWLCVYYCYYKAVRGGEWRLGSFSQKIEIKSKFTTVLNSGKLALNL
jgi:hypothetical protein